MSTRKKLAEHWVAWIVVTDDDWRVQQCCRAIKRVEDVVYRATLLRVGLSFDNMTEHDEYTSIAPSFP